MGGCGVNCTTEQVGAELVTFQFQPKTVVKVLIRRIIGNLKIHMDGFLISRAVTNRV
jgi:hypothetical protein